MGKKKAAPRRKGPTPPRVDPDMELIQRPCCHALGNPRRLYFDGEVTVRHNAPCRGKRKKNVRYSLPEDRDISKELV